MLSLAVEGLYRPLWSERILEELEFCEAEKLGRSLSQQESIASAARLVSIMKTNFSDAMVFEWEGLEGTFGLPDPDDEHVVSAALVGSAGVIVTDNIKDFPDDLMPQGIEVDLLEHRYGMVDAVEILRNLLP